MRAVQRLHPLTEAQRQTVAENLGLVGMQINRMLGRGLHGALRPEYWDELFQEGCLGLIQAVQGYDPDGGMAFTTYAVPRIHYAARRAFRRCRETIQIPERKSRGGGSRDSAAGPPSASESTAPGLPRVRSCGPEEINAIPASAQPGPFGGDDVAMAGAGERVTIGVLLRRKLEAAIDHAVERVAASTKTRADRGALARKLADERLLVPEAGYQASLREIARKTRSSYGRVAACETLLVAEVRRCLSADAEFGLLAETGARREEGMAAAVDDDLRRVLRTSVTDRMVGVFKGLPRTERAELLLTVMEQAGVDTQSVLRSHVGSLADGEGVRLLAGVSSGTAGSKTRNGVIKECALLGR